MENNGIRQFQNGNISTTDIPSNSEEKLSETQQEPNKNGKKKLWIIIGIIAGVVAVAGITAGVLTANGVFDDDVCPVGTYRVCGPLGDGGMACGCSSDPYVSLKPIIYLYPKEETELTIRLGAPERLTSSYPKYIGKWSVVAYPNGDLIDKPSGNKLYSLYWEGERDVSNLNLNTGFMVKSEDVAGFLEEKLDILGLNYKEKEEFIIYWLPKLESHAYSYIYFATEEEIEKEMPLELSVEPDTVIRIRMIFEGLDEYEEVEEQILVPAPERNGFTVVEWGGTDLTK